MRGWWNSEYHGLCRSLFAQAVMCLALVLLPGLVEAACTVEESPPGQVGPLMRHLGPDCSQAEREARAVQAGAVLKAMAAGQAIDLVGVVLEGDVLFDDLPVRQAQMPKGLTPDQQAALAAIDDGERRLVPGGLILRDSLVKGLIRHSSPKGTVQFDGPVDFQGTRFVRGVDLSRSVFQGPVTLTKAVFEREAYFVQGQFFQPLTCVETRFGPHTRFHRTVFHGTVDCQGGLFDGMAELLEVVFEQATSFDRARFGLGTGFSGSQFKKRVSFSDAIFSRETFFAFAVFNERVQFAGAQFLHTADFSNAEFRQGEDLAKARFDQPPAISGIKGTTFTGQPKSGQSSTVQFLITAGFLLAAALLVAYAYKLK